MKAASIIKNYFITLYTKVLTSNRYTLMLLIYSHTAKLPEDRNSSLEPGSLTPCANLFINSFMYRRYMYMQMEGECLEEFDHVLDIDELYGHSFELLIVGVNHMHASMHVSVHASIVFKHEYVCIWVIPFLSLIHYYILPRVNNRRESIQLPYVPV